MTGQHTPNDKALDFIEAFLTERGMHVYRTAHEGYGALVATTQQTKTPRVMLIGHIDVVPASQALFTLREDGGKLYGRGVWDMKSGIAGYLMAVEALRESLGTYDFGIMLTTDEETRDLGVKNMLDEGFCPTEAAVIFDGGYDWQLQKQAKGALYGTITLTDKTGHGSRPWLVNSTSMRLVELLAKLQGHFVNHGPTTNTLNISVLKAGEPGKAINQIPAEAMAGVDIRTLDHGETSRVKKIIAGLCEKYGATWEPFVEFAALSHNMDEPHMQAFAESVKEHTGVISEGVLSHAVSDANHFVDRGLACIVTYPIGGGHHSEEEWIDAKSLDDIPLVVTSYLQKMATLKNEALVQLNQATR